MGSFPFEPEVKEAAHERQKRRCARCGKALITDRDDYRFRHAHHVFPQQAGSNEDPSHSWIASVENCVWICKDEHLAAHGGHWGTGGIAPPNWFPFSHNIEKVKHQEWVRCLSQKADLIWGPMREAFEGEQEAIKARKG
jgi:hypothetical protein